MCVYIFSIEEKASLYFLNECMANGTINVKKTVLRDVSLYEFSWLVGTFTIP